MATSRRARRACSTLPPITHAAEHISHEAIGYSLDWFAKTLQGGTPRPVDDQIWFRKEFGTLVALLGFVALLLGAFDGLLEAADVFPAAAAERRRHHAGTCRSQRPPLEEGLLLTAFIPALTYYPALALGRHFVKPSLLPQGITNQIAGLGAVNALITLALM